MILVTGASGNVGRQVVEQLVAAGEPVRAVSRDPARTTWPTGVETVAGDLVGGVPPEAFHDVRAVHLFPAPEGVDDVVTAARAAGVEHVTVLSSLSASWETDNPLQRRHTAVERAVEGSGLTWTHLRPGMFMTNTLAWAPAIRAGEAVRAPYGESVAAPVHEADIAAVAVAALLDPTRHAGAAYELSGPEALSQRDRVRVLAEVLGREVRFEEQSRAEVRAAGQPLDERATPRAAARHTGARGRRARRPRASGRRGRPQSTTGRDFARVAGHRKAFTAAP